jgi:class 3 adenylate cyclase
LQRALEAAQRSPSASAILSQLVEELGRPDPVAEFTREQTRNLDAELRRLRSKVESAGAALKHREDLTESLHHELLNLKGLVAKLESIERLAFILGRVKDTARALLHQSQDFQRMFLEPRECHSFVVSVDVRRSTELMLKAREPEQFARFVTELCETLKKIIISHYGVFDKFTGDGILAFFPDFYSGPQAATRVALAAGRCHESFRAIYDRYRGAFTSVLSDTGLGVGVDYGLVNFVRIADGFTVVGPPVVYACRMAGGRPYQTLANQPAFAVLAEELDGCLESSEVVLRLKNEGDTICHSIRLRDAPPPPRRPDWETRL